MSISFSSVSRRYISSSSVFYKYATVRRDGNRNKEDLEERGEKKPWMIIHNAGNGPLVSEHRRQAKDDSRISDPKEAQISALERMNRFAQGLKTRGYVREQREYQPREDVEDVIKSIYEEYFSPVEAKEESEDLWLSQPLKDLFIKFKFLNECEKQLEHEVPSPDLHLMKTVGDVLAFYKTPIRGLTTYDDLARRKDELPPNLNVINQYIRFNPETDTFFGGKDAYPGQPMIVTGVRAKEKYENIKIPFEWPDV